MEVFLDPPPLAWEYFIIRQAVFSTSKPIDFPVNFGYGGFKHCFTGLFITERDPDFVNVSVQENRV